MIHQTFHCPSCGELGFLDVGEDDAETELIDAVCHYCGHVVTAEEVIAAQDQSSTTSRRVPSPRR